MSDGPLNNRNEVNLIAAKRELLSLLLEKEGIEFHSSKQIHPRQDRNNTPLSFGQERLWFLDQLEPGSSVYNLCRAQRLKGPLDTVALERGLNEIVCHHEILRTTFPAADGRPVQIITPTLTLSIPLFDLQELSSSAREVETARIIHKEARYAFDLSRGPLLRVALLVLGIEEYVLVLTTHQIVCDGWSMGLLFRAIERGYETTTDGRPALLPELSIQYGDYAEWHRQRLQGEILASQLSYWKKQLADMSSVTEVPGDRSRPEIQRFEGKREHLAISDPVSRALKELCQQENVTLFVALLAAFYVLLHRYTEQEDITVGSPWTNRQHPQIQNLVGFFVNTLVLRAYVSRDFTFRELVREVRDIFLAAIAHQELPFETLVEEFQQVRDLSRNPLFQVMFAFQNFAAPNLALAGLTAEAIDVDTGTSKFDLTLSLAERAGQLYGFFEYNTDLFDHATIERMVEHFQTLLESIVANPDQRISDLPILTEMERHQLLVEWNDTASDYPKDFCIHELVEAQVERTPEAIAVQFEGEQLTYQELNSRANQLAHYLQGLGVGPEKLVGICVERSLEMVVGLLGILKAGGAYVPLAPSYPRERLRFMLEDAQVSVLLTQEKLVEDGGLRIEDSDLRSSILDPRIICLDRDWPLIEQQKDDDPKQAVTSENLAYVIYTSGSTGQPKGVQIEHRSVLNCLHSVRQVVELTENDVFLALTTISFDIAALEIFLPLITGAKLVLASRDEVLDAKLLLDRLKECGVTVMQATPSGWTLLLDAGWRSSRNFKILSGGEILSRPLADQLLEGGASLWNLYGPTETTIWSTVFKVEAGEGPVFIGRPINNTRIYVLDSHLQIVPIGVYGEIYIGGDGLARGYLNRPELTTERFVPYPFNDQPDSLLYRTGDRARYRPDGNVEFLGRLDNQVKIRGFRIELGEIEAALNKHPSVKECVVTASSFPPPRRGRIKVGVTPLTNSVREETPLSLPSPVEGEGVLESERNLIVYLVSNKEKPLVTELRSFLQEKLPDYMIPSSFVFLDAIPLSPNGKIDRNALPPPDGERPSIDQGFVEPRTEIEELVAQVWREVLKVDKIGVYDNFFDLGGHSLLATRVVARLRNNLSVDLPLRKLFQLPTVAGLAEHIDFLLRNQGGISVPPIVPVPRGRALPLSFSQRRLWFLQKLDPNLSAYNIPATFRIEGDLYISALEKALSEIVNRHEVLRTRIIEIDGEPFQEIVSPLTITLAVKDLSHLPKEQAEAEVQRLSIDDGRQPYNLQEAPLMRAKLMRLKEKEHVLMLNFHHVVCDGSSLIIFYQELATLYEAFLDDKDFILPALPVQYADYAIWQHELQGEALALQLAYWKQQLGPGLTTLNLPTDYERPAVQTYRGARLTKVVSEEVTKALKELSRREGVTLFMTLLATLDILLSRHTGQDDIIVGSTIAGRSRPEIDGLIGFFINALALRSDLSGNPTFLELLKRVRDVCLDAYTHQDLPFEKVVEEINPQRDLSRNPLFQVMFNMVDISERVLKLAGCQTVKLSTSVPEAKFDIVLHAPEVNGKIELAIVYNVDLFSERRIINILDQFTQLLSQVVDDPQKGIDEFCLVTTSAASVIPDPTESLDDSWKGSIHELFSRQAERAPGFPAVIIDPDSCWSYGELDRRSNQLANYLIVQGIKPKDVVTIYAQRSAALVIALLGVLKAGAAFVILDPAYPASRLISYLRIARPRAWLHIEGAGEMAEELKEFLTSLGLCCELTIVNRTTSPDTDPLKAYSELDPNLPIQADDPAYIAFTSGSTGEPKGVRGRHGPMTHFLPWQEEQFDLSSTDRFCLLSGLAYNHLHRDVFTPLALGATLYIPPVEIVREPAGLTEWLRENSISVLHLTPALGQLLLTAGTQPLPAVRRVFFGGDVLTRGEVARIRELAPNATIGSFYGATETQRAVGYYEIPLDFAWKDTEANSPIPLGRGIKDVQLLLLNKAGNLAGVGELAELYVRSPHLAEGYIGDETLTKERFLRNPFTNDPTDRLYRTGELGRYLPDGNVEWAGRNDRRVNIRGFRVELEEIEAVLKQHPTVANAAVVLQDYEISSPENLKPETRNPKLDQRLVAYVVAEEEQQSLVDLLHSYVSARLPDYMVPTHFVILGRLPLTPNGKVDYHALPPADQSLTGQRDSFMAPRNDLEANLCKIFSQVLGIQQVGVERQLLPSRWPFLVGCPGGNPHQRGVRCCA